ncbi:MAG TPA: 50S ribosomal protein L32e [Thermoplasmata archaeon]
MADEKEKPAAAPEKPGTLPEKSEPVKERSEAPKEKPDSAEAPEATPKKAARKTAKPATDAPAPTPAKKKAETKPAPRRPTLDPAAARLLLLRRAIGVRRPKFVRTASHRYHRIGRWESWRAPTGLQSKQRRHYGYRPVVVSIGFRGPKATRGLTPTGFKPILVRTEADVGRIDPAREAVLIARTVGTRRRLVLEESCRKLGIHILNPIVKDREAT